MRFLSFFLGLWFWWVLPAMAQSRVAQAVVFTDSSQMMSTPGLDDDPDAMQQIREQTSASLAQQILAWSDESAWPGDLATLDGRNNNRAAINRMHAWQIVTLSDGRAILWIPAADNQDLPPHLRPVHDIYMVILANGFRATGGTRAMPDLSSPPSSSSPPLSSFQGLSPVEFVDSSEMMSTPLLDNSVQAQILAQTNQARLQDILAYCNENNWPSAIRSLEGRNNNRPTIASYHAYLLVRLENNQSILWIPASENRSMPEGFVPSHDFYMLINNVGIQVAGPAAPVVHSITGISQNGVGNGFASQLNTLIAGLKTEFDGLMGAPIPTEKGMLSNLNTEYESRIALEDASRTYFSKTFSGTRLIAVYGEFRDQNEGMSAYKNLVERVKNSPLPCCSFVRNEQVLDNLWSTSFIPFDPDHKMVGLENAIVDIQLLKTTDFDDHFQSYTVYRLLLSIYRLK